MSSLYFFPQTKIESNEYINIIEHCMSDFYTNNELIELIKSLINYDSLSTEMSLIGIEISQDNDIDKEKFQYDSKIIFFSYGIYHEDTVIMSLKKGIATIIQWCCIYAKIDLNNACIVELKKKYYQDEIEYQRFLTETSDIFKLFQNETIKHFNKVISWLKHDNELDELPELIQYYIKEKNLDGNIIKQSLKDNNFDKTIINKIMGNLSL